MKLILIVILIIVLLNCDDAQSHDWQVQSLSVYSQNNGFNLDLEKLTTPFDKKPMTDIGFSCPNSKYVYPLIKCTKGQLSFKYDLNSYQFELQGWFNLSNNTWDIVFGSDENKIKFYTKSSLPDQLIIQLNQVTMPELYKFLGDSLSHDFKTVFLDMTANISAQFNVDFSHNLEVKSDYQIDDVNWESEDGSYVFSGAQFKGQFDFQQNNNNSSLITSSQISLGEALFKDIYLLFSDSPISINSTLLFDNQFMPIENKLQINQSNKNQVNINLQEFDKGNYDLDIAISDLGQFKKKILNTYLEIIGVNDLDVIGQVNGHIVIQDNNFQSINMEIENLSLEIESKKIQAEDLNASLVWNNNGPMQTSHINWQSLLVAGMPINAANIYFSSVAQKLKLNPQTTIPIFDGSLNVHELMLDDIFKQDIDIAFDGDVTPISLELITEKMNWPIMQGNISGNIPAMKKTGQRISFDGSLEINVFDGQMQLDNLSMERLFGIAPVIAGDISFQNLNLKQITSTFDFGEITGQVAGYVNGLRITNWKAERLDAYIRSVPNKKIKQTISQRAIDNISSIGGIQGALSRSFLRFFDSFKYKKLGFGCKLRSSICEMSGLKTADNTYTLIEGRGLPSINIIGFQKFIDWQVFINRLLRARY